MRKKKAHMVSCQQQPVTYVTGEGREVTEQMWVALDSAGRRFIAPTEKEATRMLQEYNA